jgi:hypothetical protein
MQEHNPKLSAEKASVPKAGYDLLLIMQNDDFFVALEMCLLY